MYYTNISLRGKSVLLRGIDDRGKRFTNTVKFSPELFISTQEKSKYKTIEGKPVSRLEFDTIPKAREWVKKYKDIEQFIYYGNTNYVVQYAHKTWKDEIDFDSSKIRKFNIDIEVMSNDGFPEPDEARHPITTISVYDSIKDKIYAFGYKEDFNPSAERLKEVTDRKWMYIYCSDEKNLISSFLAFWEDRMPDVVTGWNCKFFDIPYLVNRINLLFGDNAAKVMSPWKMIHSKQVVHMNRETNYYSIVGVDILDYMELYEKYTYTGVESMKLNHIAFIELDEEKLDYDEYHSLHTLYEEDYEWYVLYNMRDVELVQRLDEKLGMIDLHMTLSYKAKINFEAAFSPSQLWDSMIYGYLKKTNTVVPQKIEHPHYKIVGGYVKQPIIGMHDWVVSFDVASLYPNIIRSLNISIETIADNSMEAFYTEDDFLKGEIDFLKGQNPDLPSTSLACNGMRYNIDKFGIIPEMVGILFKERKEIKKTMYNEMRGENDSNLLSKLENEQMSIKIAMNSLYGLLDNRFFRYYNRDNAEAVTRTGRYIIQYCANGINEYLNKILGTGDKDFIIAIDTDSNYINLGPFVDKFFKDKSKDEKVELIDKICKEKLTPLYEKLFKEAGEKLNFIENHLSMDREVIAERVIWTGKKRYILSINDKEGIKYKEPKIKITGIQCVRSDTPALCAKFIKDTIKVILEGTEEDLQNKVECVKLDFMSRNIPEIATPNPANNLEKYSNSEGGYVKGTPMQVKAAIIYNKMIKDLGLEKKYPLIKEGEKVKFILLKTPNPTTDKVMAFINDFPIEFDMNEYVDMEAQFKKTYLKPVESIVEKINWQAEQTSTLRGMFR